MNKIIIVEKKLGTEVKEDTENVFFGGIWIDDVYKNIIKILENKQYKYQTFTSNDGKTIKVYCEKI